MASASQLTDPQYFDPETERVLRLVAAGTLNPIQGAAAMPGVSEDCIQRWVKARRKIGMYPPASQRKQQGQEG